tara:strand:+ start:3297 stop:3989 length:693 start_codon:yes stop_codon:yes gene_type:complete
MKTIVIMGNGPSLRKVDFNEIKKYDSFGLNAAYRVYIKKNFYPTYFGSFDCRINEQNHKHFEALIKEKNNIKKFFLIGSYDQKQNLYNKDIIMNERFQKINFRSGENKLSVSFDEFNDFGSSGANAVQSAILMGYKQIILLGCDDKYFVTNGMDVKGPVYEIKEQVKNNPNSWFDEYHIKGDINWTPKQASSSSWKIVYENTPDDVEIINCSEGSQIPYFKKDKFINYYT